MVDSVCLGDVIVFWEVGIILCMVILKFLVEILIEERFNCSFLLVVYICG